MKSEWKRCTIEDIASISAGGDKPRVCSNVRTAETPFPVFSNGLENCGLYGYTNKAKIEGDTITISARGVNVGTVCYRKEPFLPIVRLLSLIPDRKIVNARYLYYLLRNTPLSGTGSAQPQITVPMIKKQEICIHNDIETQKSIAGILSCLDDKIALNTAINENLEQQVRALYRQMFVNSPDSIASVCRADEFFDISIGKTPPRKEPQWFTTNPSDVTWVSISDMGSCGTFICSSSEQLTAEAVEKFNIKIVPSNTVLLSFKLTVGRIAITDGEMTTNEAIAHFKTDTPEINEYLYCYLKDFNYQTMGSTSSIATAVNSKIIKAMPFSVPAADALEQFHGVAEPMFSQIRTNQAENRRLAEIRDSLLPRLMSGELDVSSTDL